ncbi:MAG TPA: hypothetical protein VHC95_01085 [Opitutales bacterium]|nr:hypothetical protein [Opitutales bacterium]
MNIDQGGINALPMSLPNPVIVVPGITATYLRDDYVLPPEVVWSVMTKTYERVSLHPNNLRYEAVEPARVRADQIFEVAYRELIEELRHNLQETEDEPVPVYPFSYDWRMPLDVIEEQLAEFIQEVIQRTLLMRHYYNDAQFQTTPRVNLVAHSMGGLIITGYLERAGRNAPVGKVATLATPFGGSFEAIVQISTGTASLGTSPPSSRAREASRVTPALYHLLPSCAGLTLDDAPVGDMFDPQLWQPSVVQTLREYIRLHGVNVNDVQQEAQDLFASMLATAQAHRRRITNFRLDGTALKASDWLCVVGANSETRIRLQMKQTPTGPEFEFKSSDRDNLWDGSDNDADRWETGDGTVPFAGAIPAFLSLENLVVVTPSDYGYWEVQDRLLSSVSGFHGILPNMDMLHRLLVRHFTSQADTHGNTWGRPAPGVTRDGWKPPLPLEAK